MRTQRRASLDTLRGLLVVLMLFEHARQIFTGVVIVETWTMPHVKSMLGIVAIIRSLSHLCAPSFFFIMGVSMVLKFNKTSRISSFFVRGVVLIILQFTLENIGWALPFLGFDHYGYTRSLQNLSFYSGVLFALGGSMIITATLMRLPRLLLIIISGGMMLSPVFIPYYDGVSLWTAFFVHGLYSGNITVFYPLLPWTGITMLGVALARYGIDKNHLRKRWFVEMAGEGLFVLLAMCAGHYFLFSAPTVFGFYKYPPTALFIVVTLSCILIVWATLEKFPMLNTKALQCLGRHSLAFYLIHTYSLGLIAGILNPVISIGFTTGYLSEPVLVCFSIVVGVCIGAVSMWGGLRLERKPLDIFSVLAPGYDRFMRFAKFYRVDRLKQLLPPNDGNVPRSLLDVAGGTGYVASQFATGFERIVVIDLSEGMLRVAKRRSLETVHGSALAMPFRDGQFDAVLCTDALHHIKDIDGALSEMARVVKPGGTVLIQEFHIRGVRGWCLYWFEHLFIDRSCFVTPDELHAIMERHGLTPTLHPISRMEYIVLGKKITA